MFDGWPEIRNPLFFLLQVKPVYDLKVLLLRNFCGLSSLTAPQSNIILSI